MAYNPDKAKQLKQQFNNLHKEKKTAHINLLITEDMNRDVTDYCQKNNMSFNEFVNKLIKKDIY